MPDFSDDFNAYQPPIEVEVVETTKRFPGGLKALCIIAVILGGFGVLAALLSGIGLAAGGSSLQVFDTQPTGSSPEMQRIQQEMQAELTEVMRQYRFPSAFAALLHLLSAVLLLMGGIMTLRRKSRGPSLLTFGCLVSILYVVGDGILNVLIQWKSVPVMRPFVEELMAEATKQAGKGGDAVAAMPNLLMAGIYVALAISIAIALVKALYYVITTVYLQKDDVKAIFEGDDFQEKNF